MKKLIGLLLVIGLLVSTFAITAAAEAPVKEFVIDGELDPWYLTRETTPEDDINDYHMIYFDPFVKGGAGTGSAPYEDPVTKIEAYTAYDDNYVYFYIKVWDAELRYWNDFEPDDYEMTTDSSTGDSIDLWFDPDPLSYQKFNVIDPNGDPAEEAKKHYFCNNTRDANQGDVQMRIQGALNPADDTVRIDDYHDYTKEDKTPIYRPGYNNQLFGEYVHNVDNLCHFTFDNDPVTVNEYTGEQVSSGYGIEVRFPRNDDESNSYYFNIAANNSSIYKDERYALALGSAWWMSYISGVTIEYQEVNPFFAQDISDDGNGDGNGDVNPPEPPAPEIARGDVNGDEKIDAKDALETLKISVGKINPTDDQKAAADVDGDEKVGAKDALEILKYVVHKTSALDE